jgi:hypothetical protein
MIQYSLLGRTAKLILPEDGDGAGPRNVVFKRIDAAVRLRRLYWRLKVSYRNQFTLFVWDDIMTDRKHFNCAECAYIRQNYNYDLPVFWHPVRTEITHVHNSMRVCVCVLIKICAPNWFL